MADKTSQTVLDTVDAEWANVRQKVIDGQTAYLAGIGRYFQILPTMTDPPKDGQGKTPDATNVKPSYMDKTAAQLATQYSIVLLQTASLEIHQYRQPNGVRGFQVFLTTKATDDKGAVNVWTRSENGAGDEDYRNSAWTQVVATP